MKSLYACLWVCISTRAFKAALHRQQAEGSKAQHSFPLCSSSSPADKIVAVVADCSKKEDRVLLVQRCSDYFEGHLDVLVNNVGTNVRKPTLEYSMDDLDFLMDTNFKSCFHLSQVNRLSRPQTIIRRVTLVHHKYLCMPHLPSSTGNKHLKT